MLFYSFQHTNGDETYGKTSNFAAASTHHNVWVFRELHVHASKVFVTHSFDRLMHNHTQIITLTFNLPAFSLAIHYLFAYKSVFFSITASMNHNWYSVHKSTLEIEQANKGQQRVMGRTCYRSILAVLLRRIGVLK